MPNHKKITLKKNEKNFTLITHTKTQYYKKTFTNSQFFAWFSHTLDITFAKTFT